MVFALQNIGNIKVKIKMIENFFVFFINYQLIKLIFIKQYILYSIIKNCPMVSAPIIDIFR